jgi:signal transduction histidine kinase
VIRTAAVAMLFAGVALRALVYFADDPQRNAAVAMLALYGLLLFAGPQFIESTADTRRRAYRAFAYLLLQTLLVSALLRVPVTRDFVAALFIPLSLDAVLYFGPRYGFLCIGAFALAMVGPLMSTVDGPLFGVVMTALFSGICTLSGVYAYQLQKAEAARQRNKELIGELRAAHQQLQGYISQAEEISAEQERGRLARELHDSVTQTVFSMNLTVQSARLLLAREPGRAADQLVRLEALAAGALSEIQTLVTRLRPPAETVEGLPGALRRLADERLAHDGLRVALEVSGERPVPPQAALGLYAIVQEALNNVARHAGTGQAFVRLNLDEGGAWLEIADQGPGFDPRAALAASGHLGLGGMAERAREIGWDLAIDSAQGRGTRIRIEERAAEAVK